MKKSTYEKIVSHWIPLAVILLSVFRVLFSVWTWQLNYNMFLNYLLTHLVLPFWIGIFVNIGLIVFWVVFYVTVIRLARDSASFGLRIFSAVLFGIDALTILIFLCIGVFHGLWWYTGAALEAVMAVSQAESIRLCLEREEAFSMQPVKTGARRFEKHRAEFQALQEALRGLPVTKIGKELPAAAVKQEAAGWQVCSEEALSDDALAHLGDALTPLADVLHGVSVQAPFTYFYVSPACIGGRLCLCYSPDGTEPTQYVRELCPIEPHWFSFRLG